MGLKHFSIDYKGPLMNVTVVELKIRVRVRH